MLNHRSIDNSLFPFLPAFHLLLSRQSHVCHKIHAFVSTSTPSRWPKQQHSNVNNTKTCWLSNTNGSEYCHRRIWQTTITVHTLMKRSFKLEGKKKVLGVERGLLKHEQFSLGDNVPCAARHWHLKHTHKKNKPSGDTYRHTRVHGAWHTIKTSCFEWAVRYRSSPHPMTISRSETVKEFFLLFKQCAQFGP